MKSIGGYFELELKNNGNNYHPNAVAFKSGRASLQYILELVKPSLVYIPFYTCDGLIEPFTRSRTKYQFYEINDRLEPVSLPVLKKNEYFLCINYFDLQRELTAQLSEKYDEQLIVDSTLAFFVRGNGKSWFFNSCRKFFGVPDGSYLYAPKNVGISLSEIKNEDYLVRHLIERFNGNVRDGYNYFLENEILLGGEVSGMSKLSEYLLSSINYTEVAEARKVNYSKLHQLLGADNALALGISDDSIPMFYPFLSSRKVNKNLLFEKEIFVPTFWKDVLSRSIEGFRKEKFFTEYLLPLPIDHRYSQGDMERMANIVKSVL